MSDRTDTEVYTRTTLAQRTDLEFPNEHLEHQRREVLSHLLICDSLPYATFQYLDLLNL
ncbi:hypothetical protein [Haladaptatus pallidirubidus]|uniref:hypothetical protein n=1 Tax=Haladaptatus pallidirubidus TaxID=1008152 RepID=UPI001D122867|nr:hypothetical protein [Haladaptatus pallidirubidus]